MVARETVLADVRAILEELMGDWEFEGEVREDAYLFMDLGLESIDAVALGTGLEEKYQQSLPFAQFLLALQEQERIDFTIGHLVDFVTAALNSAELGAAG